MSQMRNDIDMKKLQEEIQQKKEHAARQGRIQDLTEGAVPPKHGPVHNSCSTICAGL